MKICCRKTKYFTNNMESAIFWPLKQSKYIWIRKCSLRFFFVASQKKRKNLQSIELLDEAIFSHKDTEQIQDLKKNFFLNLNLLHPSLTYKKLKRATKISANTIFLLNHRVFFRIIYFWTIVVCSLRVQVIGLKFWTT